MNKIYLFKIENLYYFYLILQHLHRFYVSFIHPFRFVAIERKVNDFFHIITIYKHKTLSLVSATFVQYLRDFTGPTIATATIFD